MRISRWCYETVVSVCFGSGEKTRFLGEIFGALFHFISCISQILLPPLLFILMDIVQVLASSAEEVRRPLSREGASSRSSGVGFRHGFRLDYP